MNELKKIRSDWELRKMEMTEHSPWENFGGRVWRKGKWGLVISPPRLLHFPFPDVALSVWGLVISSGKSFPSISLPSFFICLFFLTLILPIFYHSYYLPFTLYSFLCIMPLFTCTCKFYFFCSSQIIHFCYIFKKPIIYIILFFLNDIKSYNIYIY